MNVALASRIGLRRRMPAKQRILNRYLLTLVIVLASVVYGSIASTTYLNASPAAIVVLSLLFGTGLAFLTFRRPARFSSFDLVTVAFLLAFMIGPLAPREKSVRYYTDFSSLLLISALYTYASYLVLATGYYAPRLFRREQTKRPRRPLATPAAVERLGYALYGIGLLSYVALVTAIGGPAELFVSEKTRMQLFVGYGPLFWLTTLLVPGSVLHCARWACDPKAKTWQSLWLVGLTVLLLLPLQGRSRAGVSALCALFVFYLSGRPIRWRYLVPAGIAGALIVMFVGFARQPEIRPFVFQDPVYVFELFGGHLRSEITTLFAGSLARLWMVMLVIDRTPDSLPYEWGRTFLAWFNPIARKLGWPEQPSYGWKLWEEAIEINPYGVLSGLNPSLIGEMRANFPWPLALVAMFVCGRLLGMFEKRLAPDARDPGGIAIYALIGSALFTFVFSSLSNDLQHVFFLVVPAFLGIRISDFVTRSQKVRRASTYAPTPARSQPAPR